MLDRAACHELKMTVEGADFKAYIDGELALEYTLGSEPRPGRNGAAPNPYMYPARTFISTGYLRAANAAIATTCPRAAVCRPPHR